MTMSDAEGITSRASRPRSSIHNWIAVARFGSTIVTSYCFSAVCPAGPLRRRSETASIVALTSPSGAR